MSIEQLSPKSIKKSRSSYVDPNGYVFEHNNELYRAIRKESKDFYMNLFNKGILDDFIKNRNLVPSTISNLKINDPDITLVIKHERIEPLSYCVEWCPAMLRDAAIATIDLLAELNNNDATLQDAYPWNILFKGTNPCFIDLTSIVQVDKNIIWPAYDQFKSFFLRPLILSAQGKSVVARSLLYNNITGITQQNFFQNISFFYKLTHPLTSLDMLVDEFVQRNKNIKKHIRHIITNPKITIDKKIRMRFYKSIRRKLDSFKFEPQDDVWSLYYNEIAPEVKREFKLEAISNILENLKPKTVVDIGCNTGVFSVLAAQKKACVISIDNNEVCISKLYCYAKKNCLNITPLISDVLCTTPPFGFMGTQYPSLIKRVKSEMVLCLALMHHLHISGRQSFDRIAQLLNELATKHLVFEFIAMEDSNNDLLGAGRTIKYDFNSVTNELQRYFPNIEVFDSDRPTRKILLCSKSTD